MARKKKRKGPQQGGGAALAEAPTGKGKGAGGRAAGSTGAPGAAATASSSRSLEDFPLWITALIYLGVTAVLFRSFIFGSEMLFGSDTEALGYMARAFYAEELRNGNFPLWQPLLLGGTPFLESLAGGESLYPLAAPLLLIMEPFRALGWKLVLHVALAGFAMYGWTRALGISRPASFLAGLGYLLAPFFVTLVWPGHDGKMFVTALTPLLFWAVERYYVTGFGRAWSAIVAVVALATLTTHFQMAYFLFIAAGAYALFRTVQMARRPDPVVDYTADPTPPRAMGRFGLFLVAAVVGVGAAGIQFLPAIDYIRGDSRRTATTTEASAELNKQFAASWSMHAEEAFASLLVPEFVGNSTDGADWTRNTYWGRNTFKLNHEYIGLVLLILAGLSFFGAPRSGVRWFFLGLFGVAFLYTLGAISPVWQLFYHLVPGIKLFRAASMVIFLAGFAAITLAAFGIDLLLGWQRGEVEPTPGATRWLIGSTAALGVVFVLASTGILFDLWTAVLYGSIPENRAAALLTARPFIVRGSVIALALAGATLWLGFAAKSRKVPAVGLVIALGLLITIDGLRVDLPFIRTRDFDELNTPGPIVEELQRRQEIETPFRVYDFNRRGEEVRTAMFGLELSSGHHPNDLARYRELIGMTGGGSTMSLLASETAIRLTNTRYLIWPAWELGRAEQYADQFPGLAAAVPVTGTQLQDGSPYEILYRFDDLPRARLVTGLRRVEPGREVETILAPDFDPATTAVVTEVPDGVSLAEGDPTGEVEWLERGTDGRLLRVTSDRAALLVIADNWVDAWTATVDGETAPVLRVNHTQLGIPVPAGTHEVEVTFASGPVGLGLWITFVCSILAIVVAVVSFIRSQPGPAPRPAEQGLTPIPTG